MKVKLEGKVYEFDTAHMQLVEAMEIQEKTVGSPGYPHGMTLRAWQAALNDWNAHAMKALVYMLRKRAGERPDWDTLDFDLAAIEMVEADTADPPEPEAA